MNKTLFWALLVLAALAFWTWKVMQATQAYTVAEAALQQRTEISEAIGPYEISYDWWFGVFRAIRSGSIQEFEFHLTGDRDTAIAVVEVRRTETSWKIMCLKAVNGEFLNQKIIDECGAT